MLFRSFWLAGFECATGWNRHREWIDQIAATGHDLHVDEDYARLAEVGIHAVREGIRWPLVDRAGELDFASVLPFARAATQRRFDVIWDLFHYGYPDDLDPFGEEFQARFVRYCRACARFVAQHTEPPYFFTPVNEPSYFAWAAGEAGLFAPHEERRGFELKVALARAAIRGIEAIREELPQARIVNVDPICRVVPRPGREEDVEHARLFNTQWVYEFWDMVSGRMRPELGGSPQHLDIVGINYYWTNQWEVGSDNSPLADDDPRRVPLGTLLTEVWQRYGRDIVVTETAALGDARAPWIGELSAMTARLRDVGVPLHGICLYPVLGMPEWHARDQWTHMGLWDIEHHPDGLRRAACMRSLDALRRAQHSLGPHRLFVEREHVLERTSGPAERFRGELLWRWEREPGVRVQLYRADRPQRLWIAATRLLARHGEHRDVRTAPHLGELIEELRARPPAHLAQQDRPWGEILSDLEASATQLELIWIRPAG